MTFLLRFENNYQIPDRKMQLNPLLPDDVQSGIFQNIDYFRA
jgi:hypothetical protein